MPVAAPVNDSDELNVVEKELRYLAKKGMFDRPDFRIQGENLKRHLDSRYNSPWTKIELALAEDCNLACTYCYNGTCMDTPSQGRMEQKTAQRAVEWLFARSGRRSSVGITFFGGEPLLNKKVFNFVMDYSQKLGREHGKKVNYSMTTNGTLLDDSAVDHIKRNNFGLLVSLDGPEEVHNAQCPTAGGGPSFQLVMRGLRKLMRRRRSVSVRCTMTSGMKTSMLELIRYFEKVGFTRIVLGRTINPQNPSSVDITREEFEDYQRQEDEEILPYIFEELGKGKIPKYFPYRSFIQEQAERDGSPDRPGLFNCGSARGLMTVGANGKLFPCHRYVGMQNWVLGDINEEGPSTSKLRQYWADFNAAVTPRCGQCWARNHCKRPCAWEVSKSDGTFEHLPEWKCDLTRQNIERAAYMAWRIREDFPEMYSKFTESSQAKGGKPVKKQNPTNSCHTDGRK